MTPTDGDQFFEEQSETSRRKIEVYGKYLKPLAYKLLSGRYNRLWIVDAYAGAGAYDPDAEGRRAEGSPLAAANIARQYNVDAARRGKQIRLVNVESNDARFAKLEQVLMSFAPAVTNIHGRFQDHLDSILDMVGADPALFFIDPFGMDGAALPVIDHILERRSRTVTELLINFSHRGFQRMAGNLDASAKSPAARAAALTKVKRLNAILDTTFWQGAWRNPDLTPEEKLDQGAGLYAERLRARGIEEVHPIHMRDSWDAPTSYRLFFATRSPHGVYLMSDIVAAYERELFQERFDGTFDLDWETERRTRAMDDLCDEVHAFGLASQGARPIDIFLHFAPIHFGEWTQTDYMNCLRDLVRRGGIERNGAAGIKQRESLVFVPIAQADLFGSASG